MKMHGNALFAAAFTATLGLNTAASAESLTYTKDIAPIINENCVACHRPGQAGPMSLTSYKEIRPWAKSIRKQVSEKKMPPWHASESKVALSNDRSLTEEELTKIITWIDTGVVRGSRSDLPPSPKFSDDGWILGEPDLVAVLPEVNIPGGGPDIFKDLGGKVNLKEDRWLTKVEIKPGNTAVAHHVIAFQIRGFNVDPVGGWLGAWGSGTSPMVFPEGTGRVMKKGHSIIGNMHYHPTEKDEKDQTRIGLHFAKDDSKIQKELTNLWVMNSGFKIPAGDPYHEVRASHTFAQSGKIMAFQPHMHYRGKDIKYVANYPDGSSETLLAINDYDFGWQTDYNLAEPIMIPEGTIIDVIAHFDNSPENESNPDPTRDVTFGNESYDEMMIGFMDFIVDDGIRPMSRQEFREIAAVETSKAHPEDTYSVYFRDPEFPTVLYLPRSGEGAFILLSSNNVQKNWPISDLVWSGDEFTALVDFEKISRTVFTGTLNSDTARIEGTMVFPANENDEDDEDYVLALKGTLTVNFDPSKEEGVKPKRKHLTD
ncbi:MAG TPA: cytochrome c [Candidatus Hydrogenedentes bacterium]|nr:cytochrome c [Candidatus Hydrogenedentota bacterium]